MSISISGNGSITGATTSYSFDQSVSIGGTLTYEDVTNIDTVGIATFRDNVHIGAGATTAFFDVNNGRFGVGTASPAEILEVTGNIFINTTESYTKFLANNTGESGLLAIDADSNERAGINFQGVSSNQNTAITFSTSETVSTRQERARIDNSGRLLVGTTSSSDATRLVVQANSTSSSGTGSLYLLRGNANPTSGQNLTEIQMGNGNANMGASIVASCDGDWTDGSDQPTRLVFSTTADSASSPTERMRIRSDGYAHFAGDGIGYTANNYHGFHSNGTTQWTAGFFHNGTGASPYGILIQYVNSNPGSAGNNQFLQCYGETTKLAEIRSDGGIANYTANDANLCDEREKKNIETLDSTWDCLKHWEVKKFHYIQEQDTDDKKYGVIAQQIAPHCPEVITDWVKQDAADAVLDEDGNVVTEAKEEIVRMGVKEQQMMWMAIKALQEAQTRIETLEAEVAALKGA